MTLSNVTACCAARYAVLGHPVSHSQSPFIHESFAQQTGQHITYEKLLSPLDAFADTARAFAHQGGKGCNVTVPFKFEAPALATQVTARARLAGAANVLGFAPTGWWADNTDGIGLVRDIVQGAGVPVKGRRVLLVGAGGAAAGVLGPLIEALPAEVLVVNRTADRATALAVQHSAWAARHGVVLAGGGLLAPQGGFDVVINASSSSLHGGPVPVASTVLAPGALAVDLMYGAAAQPFLVWAQAHGAHARDGLGMLVEQAAEAFFLWRGVRPDTPPVLAALRQRLREHR